MSVVLAIVLLKKKDLKFGIQKKDFRINGQCKRFLKVGLPLALQEFLTQMSFLALCAFVNKQGLVQTLLVRALQKSDWQLRWPPVLESY